MMHRAATTRHGLMLVIRRELLSSPHARVAHHAEEGLAMHMATETKRWTLEEVHSLPDDGNKYELVRGELFVTPPPTDGHETISARLTRILDPYVAANGLGFVYRPRAVVRFEGSEVEPDLMVRSPHPDPDASWDTAPIPILVVEILSGSTRRRDRHQKRSLYMDAGVAEYWIVDPETSRITSVRNGREDVVADEHLTWTPRGVASPLTIELGNVFGDRR
jgi:Uma2 family endonuclease